MGWLGSCRTVSATSSTKSAMRVQRNFSRPSL
jgi:hypothetical protein